jgi:hypothetical protein
MTQPHYAGVWFDTASKSIVIGMTAGGDESVMATSARAMLADRIPQASEFPIEVRVVKYSFAQLAIWRNQMRQFAFDDPAIVGLDLDERANRVLLLATSDQSAAQMAAKASSLGIPAGAVIFRRSAPVRTQAQLTDHRRPVDAGFQIVFHTANDDWACTVGANVWAPGGPRKGFLTASHCSKDLGTGNGVDGIGYYQPNLAYWNYVGQEAIDPPLFTGGNCPTGKSCRWSDVLWADYSSDSYFVPYTIAETTTIGSGYTPGSLTVARYRSTQQTANVLVGFTVRKTGRSTGTTQGLVSAHCMDVPKPTSNVVMLCQDLVAGPSYKGDSGSPAYLGFNFSDPNSTIYHVGIQWGGYGCDDCITNPFIVSPWSGIFTDMSVYYKWP